MADYSGSRDLPARVEAMMRSALNSDQGRRKIAAARNVLAAQLASGRLTAESVLEVFRREVDKAVANYLSHDCSDRVGYHAYAASGIAQKEARRLADQFLANGGRGDRG